MSADMIALAVGTLLAVGALAFVLHPLFFGAPADTRFRRAGPTKNTEDSAVVALREIEFDRATGKLSEPDYAELRSLYTARALRELRAEQSAPSDPIEARVRAYRSARRECPSCGLRPEPDAIYCSTCGGFLEHACPDCGSEIAEPGAVFCSTCGGRLTRAFASRP